jgi:Transglycosylase SLT domain
MAVANILVDGAVIGTVDIIVDGAKEQGNALPVPADSVGPVFRPGIGPGSASHDGAHGYPHSAHEHHSPLDRPPTFRPHLTPHGPEWDEKRRQEAHDEHAKGPMFRPGIQPGEHGHAPFAQGSSVTDRAIADASRRYGLNPNTMRGIASIESSMNPNSNANRSTQYKGLFQIGRSEWAQYGHGGNIYDARQNADAAGRMLSDHADWFRSRYGRKPTDAELYMMHQQGRGFFSNGAMTNIGGNPYPGMRGAQDHNSFMSGWGRELARRKAVFERVNPEPQASAPQPSNAHVDIGTPEVTGGQ